MADRYGGRDSERYGGRDEDDRERRERYRQGLGYRGPYDVSARRGRGYEDEASGGREDSGDYRRGYERDYDRGYGRGSARDYGRGSARPFERDDDDRDEFRYGRERYYGGARGPAYGREYGGEHGRGEERGYERGYGRGYDYEEDERDYGREEGRGGGRGAQTDYGRTSSRFFGRGGGEYEGRYGRGYDYDVDDDERGRRGYDYEEGERGGGRGGRGWLDRVSDEVASWFGDRDAVRRRRLDEKRGRGRGRGPKNYRRSDERIREDINDRLSDQDYLDASEIEVAVSGGEVTLSGTVETRYDKRLAEDIAESVSGVTHVQNNLRVEYRGVGAERNDETTVVAARPAATAGASNDPTFHIPPGTSYDATADTMPGFSGETTATNPTTSTTTGATGATGDAAAAPDDTGGASSGGVGR